jgi:putative tricarboxylic transport membrane protein
VALAALALWASAGLEAGRLRAMGPGMMPRAVAALVGLVGLLLVALALLRAGEPLRRWAWRGPLFLTLGVVGFALTIRPVGLALAGPLVAMVGGAASPESRPRELAIFAVAITAFCILLFRVLLRLPIPVLNVPGLIVL